MSLKRGPTSDLNHDNWDKEDKPEEKGVFAEASTEEIQNRVIKKARRKLTGDQSSPASSSYFSNFKGFGSFTNSGSGVAGVASSSPFSFLSNIKPAESLSKEENANKEESGMSKDFQFDHSTLYYSKLKGLNQAVSNWIKKHIDENPLCILTPVFQDYEKYLKEIQEELKNGKQETQTENNNKTNTFKISNFESRTIAPALNSPFGMIDFTTLNSGNKNKSVSEKVSTFNQESSPKSSMTFNFLKSSSETKVKEDNEPPKERNEDEDDEPPKVEFTPIIEEDSIYSKRCKVFVKKDDKYSDLGIGTLHLKSVKDSNKTQLIVRADTNLGKILLNLILNDGIPTQKMGKNNVMMVCIPTPESEQKPVTVLLRVKNGEEADELLETINVHKNKK